ncbi:MAG: type II toxin-antitoxin system VapC family toxin [Bacillota bacterium]
MAAVIVDTSAIYALLDRSDANHAQAVVILGKLRDNGDVVVMTNLVLAETHALLLSKLGYTAARTWLRGQIWPVERVLPEDEERAVDIVYSYEDKTFSYTDATTFAVAERLGIEQAFAFDRHFLQFGLVLVE